MNLVINIDATDKSEAAVASIVDRTPVAELDELILGNQEPLTIAFCDDAGAVPAWVTDPATMLVVGIGLPDLHAGKLYAATDDFAIDGSTRTGVLNLDTTALRDALALACQNCAGDAGRWLTLEVAKMDASGQTETLALLHVMVLWRVLETPANNTTYRYPAVLYDTQTGLLYRPAAIPVLSGGVPRGGSVNQVLTKIGPDDFDVDWRDGGTGSGSVTSVGLKMPDIFSVAGSPVTTAGTLAATLVNQAANLVFAGPVAGGAAAPAFRALVSADIPDLSASYLTPASAAATYLTQADASSTYLTIASAVLNFQPLADILTALSALSDSAGWLHNDGAGSLAWSTPTKGDVGLGNVENTAISTWTGSTSLTTLGTVGTGTWQATAIGTAYGGVKAGGTTGQVLRKASNTDYDIEWGTPTSGTVTSVALTMPDIFTVGGSPITSAGTFTVSLEAQSANRVFAGPSSGGTAAPTFRLLVAADIPDLSATYQPLDGDLTAIAGLSGTGGAFRTGGSAWALRSIAGTSARITITNGDGVAGNPTIDIASTYVGQNTITTLGTIATGTWQGTAIGAQFGGTGQTSYTIGDLLYASSTTALSKLAAVAVGQVFVSAGTGTAPAWSANPRIGSLGVGLAAASGGPILRVTNNASGLPTAYSTSQVVVHIGNTDATAPSLLIDGAGERSLLELRRAGGTVASPTALTSGTNIGTIGWRGYATTTTFTARRAEITGATTEDWTASANGCRLAFSVTPTGSTTMAEYMSLTSALLTIDAGSGVGGVRLLITTTDATGAMVYGATNGAGSSNMGVTSAGNALVRGTTSGKNLLFDLNVGGSNTNIGTVTSTATTWTQTTEATSTTAAAYVIAGGLGVAKTLYVGSDINSASAIRATSNSIQTVMGNDGTLGLFGTSTNHGTAIWVNSTVRVTVSTAGSVRFNAYGAGTLVTDSSGNITASSDRALKELVGRFTRGLPAIRGLSPWLFKWNKKSRMDERQPYAGLVADDVEQWIPEAVGRDPQGYRTLADMPIICATVNAIQELATRLEALEQKAAA